MSHGQDDVLLLALANNELDKFLIGEPFYFQEAITDNDEPQNVIAAFDLLILRHWRGTSDIRFADRFVAALLSILSAYADRNRAIYVASEWVWYYRHCLNKKRTQPEGEYGDLFEIDLGPVAAALKQQLEEHRPGLSSDTRWAGQTWNSPDGLWTPLMRTALSVRDKLDGPDFVPRNQ